MIGVSGMLQYLVSNCIGHLATVIKLLWEYFRRTTTICTSSCSTSSYTYRSIYRFDALSVWSPPVTGERHERKSAEESHPYPYGAALDSCGRGRVKVNWRLPAHVQVATIGFNAFPALAFFTALGCILPSSNLVFVLSLPLTLTSLSICLPVLESLFILLKVGRGIAGVSSIHAFPLLRSLIDLDRVFAFSPQTDQPSPLDTASPRALISSMAAPHPHTTPVGPDTLITVKVIIEGTNRRFKLALRDLGANTLPQKVSHSNVCQPRLGSPWPKSSGNEVLLILCADMVFHSFVSCLPFLKTTRSSLTAFPIRPEHTLH